MAVASAQRSSLVTEELLASGVWLIPKLARVQEVMALAAALHSGEGAAGIPLGAQKRGLGVTPDREAEGMQWAIDFTGHRFTPGGGRQLSVWLGTNPRVSRLKLRKTQILADNMARIAEALAWNSTLTSLDLSENPAGFGHGVTALARALQSNRRIARLDISRAAVDDAQAAAIGDKAREVMEARRSGRRRGRASSLAKAGRPNCCLRF